VTRVRQWAGQQIGRRLVIGVMLILSLSVGLVGCGGRSLTTPPGAERAPVVPRPRIMEVSPPEVIQDLRREIDSYQPQVNILSPRNGEVIEDDQVTVRLRVRDLPLFKDADLGLGPYLQVFLDDQPYQAVHDADAVLIFQGLSPGTHTIRAIAARPWHETFKNEGAFALTTFHSYTKTPKNNPDPNRPLITYSFPQGNFGAEPIMLDFYLTNVPLHFIAQERSDDEIKDWRIRCTVNGESFVFEDWQPIYLEGLRPGKNWVQLELLDEDGRPTENVFNNTVRLITYEPGGTDTLSRLTRGELAAAELGRIVNPNYEPEPIYEAPTPVPTPAEPTEAAEELAPEESLPDGESIEGTAPEPDVTDAVPQPTEPPGEPSGTEAPETEIPAEAAEPTEVPAEVETAKEPATTGEAEGDRPTPSPTAFPTPAVSPTEPDVEAPDAITPPARDEAVEMLDESTGVAPESEAREKLERDAEIPSPDVEPGLADEPPTSLPDPIETPELQENPAIAPPQNPEEGKAAEPALPDGGERKSPVEVPKLI